MSARVVLCTYTGRANIGRHPGREKSIAKRGAPINRRFDM